MINEDYSTPRVNRYRLHINGDHSECLYQSCNKRADLEYAMREFIRLHLAAGIADDDGIEKLARASYDDWLIELIWPELELLRFESHYTGDEIYQGLHGLAKQ